MKWKWIIYLSIVVALFLCAINQDLLRAIGILPRDTPSGQINIDARQLAKICESDVLIYAANNKTKIARSQEVVEIIKSTDKYFDEEAKYIIKHGAKNVNVYVVNNDQLWIETLYADSPKLKDDDISIVVEVVLGDETRCYAATPLDYELISNDEIDKKFPGGKGLLRVFSKQSEN